MENFYEKHSQYDVELPLKLHLDLLKSKRQLLAHWHEPLELILIQQGGCVIYGNGIPQKLECGDMVFLNSGCIHGILAGEDGCEYYCLTVDVAPLEEMGLHEIGSRPMLITRKHEITDAFMELCHLQKEKPTFYKIEMKAVLVQLLVRISRQLQELPEMNDHLNSQCKMVRKAVSYLQVHFSEPVTIEEVSTYVGFSKYYFCRQFKEIMGQTVVDYINYLRCRNARRLIESGEYNVSESAMLSGFKNFSYFAKVYKRHMGKLPSKIKT